MNKFIFNMMILIISFVAIAGSRATCAWNQAAGAHAASLMARVMKGAWGGEQREKPPTVSRPGISVSTLRGIHRGGGCDF